MKLLLLLRELLHVNPHLTESRALAATDAFFVGVNGYFGDFLRDHFHIGPEWAKETAPNAISKVRVEGHAEYTCEHKIYDETIPVLGEFR